MKATKDADKATPVGNSDQVKTYLGKKSLPA